MISKRKAAYKNGWTDIAATSKGEIKKEATLNLFEILNQLLPIIHNNEIK
jgi:hypothetical protein